MKFNKKFKRIKSKTVFKSLEICLENFESYKIDRRYIKHIKFYKDTIIKLIIDKKYLNNINCTSDENFINDYEDKHKYILNRFRNSEDITQISINNKIYFVPYVEIDPYSLGSYNFLLTHYETQNNIVYKWDKDIGIKIWYNRYNGQYNISLPNKYRKNLKRYDISMITYNKIVYKK